MSTIQLTCPKCGSSLSGPAEMAGRQIRCAKCTNVFVAAKSAPVAAEAKSSASPGKQTGAQTAGGTSKQRSKVDPPKFAGRLLFLGLIGVPVIFFGVMALIFLLDLRKSFSTLFIATGVGCVAILSMACWVKSREPSGIIGAWIGFLFSGVCAVVGLFTNAYLRYFGPVKPRSSDAMMFTLVMLASLAMLLVVAKSIR